MGACVQSGQRELGVDKKGGGTSTSALLSHAHASFVRERYYSLRM